ncbi:hypothetical protein D3C81_2306420 [compost metagenome]
MRRVGDDHVGLRHVGHHAAARDGPLLLANTPFDMGIALLLLMFVANFLLGHLQFLEVAP